MVRIGFNGWLLMLAFVSLNISADDGIISRGERVELADHVEETRFVVVNFRADWESGSRKWTQLLERFAQKYPDYVALKHVVVESWGAPVALQYGIERLPQGRLFKPGGKRVRASHPRLILRYLERKAKKKQWRSS